MLGPLPLSVGAARTRNIIHICACVLGEPKFQDLGGYTQVARGSGPAIFNVVSVDRTRPTDIDSHAYAPVTKPITLRSIVLNVFALIACLTGYSNPNLTPPSLSPCLSPLCPLFVLCWFFLARGVICYLLGGCQARLHHFVESNVFGLAV